MTAKNYVIDIWVRDGDELLIDETHFLNSPDSGPYSWGHFFQQMGRNIVEYTTLDQSNFKKEKALAEFLEGFVCGFNYHHLEALPSDKEDEQAEVVT